MEESAKVGIRGLAAGASGGSGTLWRGCRLLCVGLVVAAAGNRRYRFDRKDWA